MRNRPILSDSSVDNLNLPKVIGRFAPSPTGALHLGSLITAVASFCLAKKAQGDWLLRIEDVDTERCRPESADAILSDLDRLGLHWDGAVRYQSAHLDSYHALLDPNQSGALVDMSYACACSRKTIADYQQTHANVGALALRYPQLCSHKQLDLTQSDYAIRLRMPYQTMAFFDQLQGVIIGNPQLEQGDIVVRRRAPNNHTQGTHTQGLINYMLAVVVDDIAQGVNQVVRGLDILPLTLSQMVITDYLHAPHVAQYYHLPLLVNADGQKLSKQTLAEPISPYSPQDLLATALQLLGQEPVDIDKPDVMLAQAIEQWDSAVLVGQTHKVCPNHPNNNDICQAR